MRSVLFAPVVVLLLCGCALATTAGYEKMLDTWVGRQEIDLVRSWGAPDRVHEVDGCRFIGFSSHHRVYQSGTPPHHRHHHHQRHGIHDHDAGHARQRFGPVVPDHLRAGRLAGGGLVAPGD